MMINRTVLDTLVSRLNQIAADVARDPSHQDALEQDVADVGLLLSGLEKIAGLLTDTFHDIDSSLLNLRISQEQHRLRLQDSLASVSTILMNYPEVFVKLDTATVKMFLENIDPETLKVALVSMDREVITVWFQILSEMLWSDNG